MMNARKKSIGILTAMFGLTMCFAIPTAISASAAETTETPATTITMEKGASLKLDKVSGLKFTATVENAKEGANYGMLILPYDYFADAEVNITDSTDYVKAFLSAWDNDVIAREPILAQNLPVVDGKISYSIHNVLENNYDREFFGIAFEKTSTEAGDTYTYATYNDNVRSIMEVASGALNAYNYEKASLSEDLIATYEANMDLLNSFVGTGVSNVIGTAEGATLDYAIEGANTVQKHDTLALTANVTAGVHLQNVWTSSNEEVATVVDGKVTTVGAGTATITLKSAGKYTATHDITVTEPVTLTIADALTLGGEQATSAYTTEKYYVSGKVVSVDNAKYGNIYIEDEATGDKILVYGLYSADGEVRYDAMEVKPDVGDTVKVVSVVGNHNGTAQLKAAWLIEHKVSDVVVTYGELTIAEAIELGNSQAANDTFTTEKYYITGTVTAVASDYYGNIYIEDANANKIYVYGLWSEDGTTRYGDMQGNKPAVGDVVTILTVVGKYNDEPQLKNAWLQEWYIPETKKVTTTLEEIKAYIPTTISEDGKTFECYTVGKTHKEALIEWGPLPEGTTAAKIEGGVLSFTRGEAEVTVVIPVKVTCGNASQTDSITVKVASNVTTKPATTVAEMTVLEKEKEYSWVKGEMISNKNRVPVDENAYFSIAGGDNSGKYYNNKAPMGIRVYSSDTPAGSITVAVDQGYSLYAVTITTASGSKAYLQLAGNTATDLSGVEVLVSGQSVTFNVVKGSSTSLAIASVKVEYYVAA